jgi:hypothetical protein
MCLACQITARMAEVERHRHPAHAEWLWAELGVLRELYRLDRHPHVREWREELACALGDHLAVIAGERDTPGQRLARLYAVATAQHDAGLVRSLEEALGGVVPGEDPFAIVAAARATYRALWTFYDGLATDRVNVKETVA